MFYATKDIFRPVIIAPVYNVTTGVLTVYAVSDLWSDVTGESSLEWVTYDGKSISSTTTKMSSTSRFVVSAINATVLASMNITEMTSNGTLPADNAVLITNLTATGTPPNTGGATRTYSHSNFFTATPLSKAKLVDPGLRITHSRDAFTVTAEDAVSTFTWVAPDHSDSAVIVVFDDNGFLLRKGESKTLSYRVVSGASSG